MAADRDREIVERMLKGESVTAVGRAHGLASPGASIRLVDRALDTVLPRLSSQLRRRIDLGRLDRLLAAWWEPALTGDLEAAGVVLAAIEARHRLGLADDQAGTEPHAARPGPAWTGEADESWTGRAVSM